MKNLKKLVVIGLVCILTLSFCACSGNNNGNTSSNDTVYTIQYTDETGIHTIDVQSGKLYSISTIPQKNGYDFMGLYDAEVGGTQYINAGGSSVSEYSDKKNIVLYPQFKAKEYTLILDYQGAAVTGSRSMKVAYDSEISELPLNLTLENKNFVGWYTEPNRNGNQIADQYGVLPENRKVTEKLFDLSDPDGNIKLYAGFKGEEFTVTFYLTESSAPEEIKVEYGTPISEVQLETRVDGKAVLVWSKKRNDVDKEQAFTGKVTSEMVLYAAEFAPVIDFDSNGGSRVGSIIAREGVKVDLPIPEKDMAEFSHWEDIHGNEFISLTMPGNSISLTAVWNGKLVFDENGGTDVDDISVKAGEKIDLPTSEKDGYIFAGWYTESKEKYTSTTMPSSGIKLKAGWYETKSISKIVINSNQYQFPNYVNSKYPEVLTERLYIDLSQSLADDFSGQLLVKVEMDITIGVTGYTLDISYYSQEEMSSLYLLHRQSITPTSKNKKHYTFDFSANITGNIIYCSRSFSTNHNWCHVSDYNVYVTYADTSSVNL